MSRHHRLSRHVGLWSVVAVALLGGTAGAGSAAASSVCARLVRQMRRSPATVLQDLSPQRRAMAPWVTYPVLRLPTTTEAYPRIAALWARPMGSTPPPLTDIEVLPGTGLFVANAILGSADCLNATFFEWHWGSPPRLIDGPRLPLPPCSRDGAWGGLAVVLGRPAYLEFESLHPANSDLATLIAPWTGSGWGRPCRVSIRYTYRYTATLRYCGATPGLCREAHKIAVAVERAYHAWLATDIDDFNPSAGMVQPAFHFGGAMSARGRSLVARARRLGVPKAVASGGGARPAWLRHLSRHGVQYFPVGLRRDRYVGAVDHNEYPMPGSRFFLLQAPRAHSRQLVPLAVFAMQWGANGVKSIRARLVSLP